MLSFERLDPRLLLSISEGTNLATRLETSPIDDPAVEASTVEAMAPAAAALAVATPAAVQATITSALDGLWSNPATWSGGQVPGPTDDVVITHNVTIDHAAAHKLEINAGTTTLAGDLQAYGAVIVRGSLVGTQGGIFFHVANDRLTTGNTTPGPDATLPNFHPEDIGLWVLPGARVDLQGSQVSSWVNALGSGPVQNLGHGVSQQVAFGGGNATLQAAPVGWRVGDTLLLVSEHGQSVLADLLAVNGASLQYRERKLHANDPDVVGHTLVTQGSQTVVYPKIADLSRRLQIVGADVREGDTNHRAFTVVMKGATANFANVELRDLGPRSKLGRYPVYFQEAGGAGNKLTDSSLWQDVSDPGNRFTALAGVQGVTVSGNVAFRSRGDGFFLENRATFGNTIANNLSVEVNGGEELSVPDSNVTQLSHHYWLRAGNTISGNVAAGGDAIGMIILASANPGTATVNGTEAFGTGLFGMWTGTPNVTFNNPVSVYNSRAGFAADPAWDVDSHGATLRNALLLFNGTDDSSYGSQIYSNNGDRTLVDGGVLAGEKAVHTHYHSSITISNAIIDIETLLVPTYWEQGALFAHDQIKAALLFERAYPSARYASPGLVRVLDSRLQVGSEPVEQETADYMGDMFQNYPALPGEPIPNAIELDHLAEDSGFIRVTMLSDAERWRTNIARWTVTPIGQTPAADTFIYHRQTAWERLADYGGYPDGFPPGEYAVKLYDENGTLLKSGFAVVRPGQVSDLTDTLDNRAQIVDRKLFYNQSGTAGSKVRFDGNNAAINALDDRAIATDKAAYLPGAGAATFANVSSYSKGINGIMIDIAGPHGTITANDFIFKTGNNNSPGSWALAPAPSSISVRAGAGVGGADRVEIIWGSNAVRQGWLQVITLANADTGLAQSAALPAGQTDTFFFGVAVGDSGFGDTATDATVNSIDETGARMHQVSPLANIPITNPYDYNRDAAVDATDQIIARNNRAAVTKFISIGAIPAAPQALPAAAMAGVSIAETDAAVATTGQSAGSTLPSTSNDSFAAGAVDTNECARALARQAAFASDDLPDCVDIEEEGAESCVAAIAFE